jgi:hypothetical protein
MDSFYVNDQYRVGSERIDLPELQFDLNLASSLGINLGAMDSLFSAFARVSSGLNLDVSYDLNDENVDGEGKLRMGDLIVQLLTDPMGLGSLDASLEASLGLKANAVLDLKPSDWGIFAGSTVLQDLIGILALGLETFNYATEYTLFEMDEQLKTTLMDSDPNTIAPSLLDWVAGLSNPSTPVI